LSGFLGSGKTTYLIIESTGIAMTLPVTAALDFSDEDGASLSDEAAQRTRVELLADQIGLTNVIALKATADQLTAARFSGVKR
jgi:G3E family GTPase